MINISSLIETIIFLCKLKLNIINKNNIKKNLIIILSLKKNYRFLKTIDFTYFYNLIESQIDLNNEGKNLNIFLKNLDNLPDVIIPKYIYSNSNLLIESFENGYTIKQVKSNYPDKIVKEALALLWWTYMRMIIKNNYIHGDIHDGNFRFNIINNKVKLILYDYGYIIELNDREKAIYNNLFDVVFLPNPNEIANFILNSAVNKINKETSNKFKKNVKEYLESLQAYDFYDRFKAEKIFFILSLGMDSDLRKKYKRDVNLITNILNISFKYKIIIDSKTLNILNGIKIIESLENEYTNISSDDFIEFKANYGIRKGYFSISTLSIV